MRPDGLQWIWISLGVGLVALAVSALTIFVAKWSHPRLRIDYIGYSTDDGGRAIAVSLYNELTHNPVLKWLGVYSRPVAAVPVVRITTGDERTEVGWVAPYPPHSDQRLTLSESVYPTSFVVATLARGEKRAILASDVKGSASELPSGLYLTQVDLEAGQYTRHELGKAFVVGDDALYWTDSKPIPISPTAKQLPKDVKQRGRD